ncbi:hypothetical protein [Fimbriiglobus ruber]|uniref:Cytoplasmic axial filament protein CafA and Ribonuclease G n=1 Tax=Fimbriiglobus ruber TaxID=1908690 RepID=A0A225DUH4_9BACT|nr:hypothetical protein [Fimbriiglobus ruber]OWK45052.1 Cytoplasmic axial filament protein CafA and Ribonuclease G [Fimbriiglobus ruber]
MPVVRCPVCRAESQVDAADLGYQVACPGCGESFVARTGDAGPPPERSRRRHDDEDRRPDDEDRSPRRRYNEDDYDDYDDGPRRRFRDPEDDVERARAAVHPVAIISIVVCSLVIFIGIVEFAWTLVNPQAVNNNPFNFGKAPGQAQGQAQGQAHFVGFLTGRACVVFLQLVVLAGSIAMLRLKSRPLAITAMVMQVLPCAGVCCIVTLPVGIWGLVVLFRPDVVEAFNAEIDRPRRRRRTRDGDDDDRYR